MADKNTPPNTDSAKNAAKDKTAAKARPKRETAAVNALALYPLPPDVIDEQNLKVLSERADGEQTIRVMTDGNSVWKEVA